MYYEIFHTLTGCKKDYLFDADKVKFTLYRPGQALKIPRG